MTRRIVKYGASWCNRCRAIPFEDEIDVDKMTDEQAKVLDELEAQELPVFIIYDNDEIVASNIGKLESPLELETWVNESWTTYVQNKMNKLAELPDIKKSPNFDSIVKARIRMKLGFDKCPCGGDGRGCISEICKSEIEKDGRCHCNCFWRIDYNG